MENTDLLGKNQNLNLDQSIVTQWRATHPTARLRARPPHVHAHVYARV